MQKLIRTLGFAMLALPLAGCHLVYTPDVQQGNLFAKSIDQKAVNQLKPGLTKEQVLALLGTPSVASPFDHDRWDYVSTYSHRGEKMQLHSMSLYFENGTLVRVEGTPFAQNTKELLEQNKKYHVSYPVNETKGDKSSTKKDEPAISVGASNTKPAGGQN
ncbi:outer membrane protein assembly factor BamE [Dyella sp. A6]|uniref:outer membrane protein assembly factor BamE n=1 Tax=Dyella aluminiiresistens TaxID=3069105 RepID=UPI002E78585F|nr:outer membrane protein assembly factor BamE [Dyella sp. A6]